ncbi:hypothetical protein N9937_01565 [bacterium]|nr:hypothetical protein [bacterium]
MKRIQNIVVALCVLAVLLGVGVVEMSFAGNTRPLGTQDTAEHDANFMTTITHADLTTAATNTPQTLTDVFSIPSNSIAKLQYAELIVPFNDTATNGHNSLTVTVGDGADADLYLTSMQLNVNGTYIRIKPARVPEISMEFATTSNLVEAVTNVTLTAYGSKTYTANDTIDFVFTGNAFWGLADLDVGEIRFYWRVDQLLNR